MGRCRHVNTIVRSQIYKVSLTDLTGAKDILFNDKLFDLLTEDKFLRVLLYQSFYP